MTTEIMGRDRDGDSDRNRDQEAVVQIGFGQPRLAQPSVAQMTLSNVQALGRRILALGQRILARRRNPSRRLRLCETLPLGERRFVAVVEFEQARFLLGATASSVVLLARLTDARQASPSHASMISEEMGFSKEVR